MSLQSKAFVSHPKFAVVGHPNKGKSSIVASLAMDDTVHISNTPGTTTKKRSFPLMVDGKVLYELFDTPGFQRARAVLAWLKAQEKVSADERHTVVEAFIEAHKHNPKFNDEIELLTPIMQGAGIIYVVDASKPYGPEYETEMEILRWTGQPSMALLNQIDQSDYSSQWKRALGHYFKMVRTYHPMQATLEEHLSILESMAQLKEEWIAPLKASIVCFEEAYTHKVEQSSHLMAQLLYQALSLVEKKRLSNKEMTQEEKEALTHSYKERLKTLELHTQEKIKHIWNHSHLETEFSQLSLHNVDLFSQESASIFGLSKKELLVTGVTSGAVTGAGIDLLFAGHTLLVGGVIGAVVGGVGAYLGFEELSEVKVLGRKLGDYTLSIGPMKNKNFPYILLGRIVWYTTKVMQHSHAKRHKVDFSMDVSFKERWLDEALQRKLEKYHKQFRSKKALEPEALKAYAKMLDNTLKALVK